MRIQTVEINEYKSLRPQSTHRIWKKKSTWGKSTNETYQHLQGSQIKGLSTDYNRYKTEPKTLKTQ